MGVYADRAFVVEPPSDVELDMTCGPVIGCRIFEVVSLKPASNGAKFEGSEGRTDLDSGSSSPQRLELGPPVAECCSLSKRDGLTSP